MCKIIKNVFKKIKCNECKSENITILRQQSCNNCYYNGVWDDEEDDYILKETLSIDEERTQVEDTGECEIGTAFGNGCYIFICNDCDKIVDKIPMISE